MELLDDALVSYGPDSVSFRVPIMNQRKQRNGILIEFSPNSAKLCVPNNHHNSSF